MTFFVKKYFFLFVVVVGFGFIFLSFISPARALAGTFEEDFVFQPLAQATSPADRSTNWGLDTTAEKSGLVQDTNTSSISTIIGRIIKPLLTMVGTLFLLLIIYAGVLWMTAGGNDERVARAKKIISASVIGLLVVVFAYTIANFIANRIEEARTAQPIEIQN